MGTYFNMTLLKIKKKKIGIFKTSTAFLLE